MIIDEQTQYVLTFSHILKFKKKKILIISIYILIEHFLNKTSRESANSTNFYRK